MIATEGMRTVDFSWLAFSDLGSAELGLTLVIRPLYVCHYDGFVPPEWRGRGIHLLILKAAKEFARSQSREHAVSWINALNWPSLLATQCWQHRRVMTLVCLRIRAKGSRLATANASVQTRRWRVRRKSKMGHAISSRFVFTSTFIKAA